MSKGIIVFMNKKVKTIYSWERREYKVMLCVNLIVIYQRYTICLSCAMLEIIKEELKLSSIDCSHH